MAEPPSATAEPRGLVDRVAVVTGAGSGIGRATALALGAMGARIVAVGRRVETLNETCTLLAAQGASGQVLEGDVRTAAWLDDLDALVDHVDVYVGNAAAFAPYARAEDVTDDDLEQALATAVGSGLRAARRLLPQMRARQFGRFVQVGSLVGRVGGRGQVAYATAKSALLGLTRTLAVESAASGVTCNLVEPGFIETERTLAAVDAHTRRGLIRRTPAARPGRPEEVAAVIAFLCSPAAGYVTGAAIPVTGGMDLGLLAPE